MIDYVSGFSHFQNRVPTSEPFFRPVTSAKNRIKDVEDSICSMHEEYTNRKIFKKNVSCKACGLLIVTPEITHIVKSGPGKKSKALRNSFNTWLSP